MVKWYRFHYCIWRGFKMVSPIFPLSLLYIHFSLLQSIPCEHTEMTKVTAGDLFYFCDLLQESTLFPLLLFVYLVS